MTANILANLTNIGIAFVVLIVCVVANIVVSCYFNTQKLHQQFSIAKFRDGLIKMLAVGVSTALQAIVVTLVPYIPVLSEFFTAEGSELFSVVAIIALYGKAILKYYLEAYNTTKDILENRNIIIDTVGDINGD